jgi:hypothetical protein
MDFSKPGFIETGVAITIRWPDKNFTIKAKCGNQVAFLGVVNNNIHELHLVLFLKNYYSS